MDWGRARSLERQDIVWERVDCKIGQPRVHPVHVKPTDDAEEVTGWCKEGSIKQHKSHGDRGAAVEIGSRATGACDVFTPISICGKRRDLQTVDSQGIPLTDSRDFVKAEGSRGSSWSRPASCCWSTAKK